MALRDFMKFMFGSGDKMSQQSLWNPQQQQMFQNYADNPIENSQLYQGGSNYLQGLMSNDPAAFKHFEAPYMQNFEQNIAPGIAERFAGMGTGSGALGSSGLQNSLAQAGRNLQTDLAGMRGQLQMQGLGQALNYAQQPYANAQNMMQQRPFENVYQPGQGGFVQNVGQGFAQGVGQALPGFLMGGPAGGLAGFGMGMFNGMGGGGGGRNVG